MGCCRPDVLPQPVMEQLARLQDNITPFDTGAARRVIESDLGQPINTIFSEFSERPIAAASLAQVCPCCQAGHMEYRGHGILHQASKRVSIAGISGKQGQQAVSCQAQSLHHCQPFQKIAETCGRG